MSPRMETASSGQPVLVFSHSHSGKVSPDVQAEPPVFWSVLGTLCADTGHYSLVFTLALSALQILMRSP